MKEIEKLTRLDNLDVIQNYVEENIDVTIFNKKDISSEMFFLFFKVIELGRVVRISLQENNNSDSETKLADIFLVLVSICNSLHINLFDALTTREFNLKKEKEYF